MTSAKNNKDFTNELDTNPTNVEPKKLTLESRFKFKCHPVISCFTACCGNINIILTPYDILRIRRFLNISADEFLLRFATPLYLEKTDLPGVKLNLDENGRCPFVSDKGCTVYEYRPTTCRYYPIGMANFHEGGEDETVAEQFFFKVNEPHCRGHEEDREWTVREWRIDQGIDKSDDMNREWMELVMRRKSYGFQAQISEPAKKIFFMASTDLDKFRDFVRSPGFKDTYDIDDSTIDAACADDISMLKFSYRYLAATLFGADGINVRADKVKTKLVEMKNKQEEMEKNAEKTHRELRRDFDELKKARKDKAKT